MTKPNLYSHRFYANENFPRPAVKHLRTLGYDVETSHEVGNSNRGIPDQEVLEFALQRERAILTLNRRDFVRLHNHFCMKHSGIVVCSEDKDYEGLAERIHNAVKINSSLSTLLIRINRPPS